MASFYSIVQYVPDAVAEERINAGVVAYRGDEVRVKFVDKWERLRYFGGRDIAFLRDFAERLTRGAVARGDEAAARRDPVTEATIREMAETWSGSIRFTAPRGSLLDVDDLLRDCESRFLAGDRSWSFAAVVPVASHRSA